MCVLSKEEGKSWKLSRCVHEIYGKCGSGDASTWILEVFCSLWSEKIFVLHQIVCFFGLPKSGALVLEEVQRGVGGFAYVL